MTQIKTQREGQGLMVLLYWYCPYCQARFHKYDEQIDQHEDGQEEDEDEE